MYSIVIDDQQAQLIEESQGDVEIKDQHGRRLGYVVKALTDEELALAKKRLEAEQHRFATKESIDHQRGLIE